MSSRHGFCDADPLSCSRDIISRRSTVREVVSLGLQGLRAARFTESYWTVDTYQWIAMEDKDGEYREVLLPTLSCGHVYICMCACLNRYIYIAHTCTPTLYIYILYMCVCVYVIRCECDSYVGVCTAYVYSVYYV